MANHIIKIDKYYLDWSTIANAPITNGMNLDEFKKYWQKKYKSSNQVNILDLEMLLIRVEEKWTSSRCSLYSLVSFNRAGDSKEHLTIDELITKYCPQVPFAKQER